MKVIIARRNTLTSKAVNHRLMPDGFEKHTAYNDKSAIEMLKKESYNLLLFVKGGLKVIHLTMNQLKVTIPLAVIGRIGVSESFQKVFEMDADEYFTRLFVPENLSLKIKQMLSNK